MSGHDTKVTFTGEEISAAWAQFREVVAPEVRDRIQKLMGDKGKPTRARAGEIMSEIMGEIWAGNVPPAIEPMLFRWMELYLGNVAHAFIEQGTLELAPEGLRVAAIGVLPEPRIMLMQGRAREPVDPIPALTPDVVDADGG